MHYDEKVIAQRIERERERLNWTKDKLAKEMNIHRNTLALWEKQDKPEHLPSFTDLLRLCKLFDCEVGYLIGEHEGKTRESTDIQAVTGLSEKAIQALQGFCVNIRDSKSEFERNALIKIRKNNIKIFNTMFEGDACVWWLNSMRSTVAAVQNHSDDCSEYIDVQDMLFFDNDGKDISNKVKRYLFSSNDIITALKNDCNHKSAILNEEIIKGVS